MQKKQQSPYLSKRFEKCGEENCGMEVRHDKPHEHAAARGHLCKPQGQRTINTMFINEVNYFFHFLYSKFYFLGNLGK